MAKVGAGVAEFACQGCFGVRAAKGEGPAGVEVFELGAVVGAFLVEECVGVLFPDVGLVLDCTESLGGIGLQGSELIDDFGEAVYAVLSAGVFFLASGDASGVEGGGHLYSMAFGFLVSFAFSMKRGF